MPDLASFGVSVRESAIRAAATSAPILLCGETGAGKTLLAQLIHAASQRARRPFVRADCASIPENLFEREIFGHTRGSFTDAKESQPGLVEAAHGGTLLLDEVGELSLGMQPKLLSVLDADSIRRIGATQDTRVDVRVVAATNRDLDGMVRAKAFRPDLYYRLAFLKIAVPPLRERAWCIPALADEILQRLCARHWVSRRTPPALHPTTLRRLQEYDWPGNIRELEHALAFAVTYYQPVVMMPEHLPPEVGRSEARLPSPDVAPRRARYKSPEKSEMERAAVLDALRSCHGNRTKAAALLGMSRATLWIKLRQLGLGSQAGAEDEKNAPGMPVSSDTKPGSPLLVS